MSTRTAARVRKAFRYSEDEDDAEPTEGMDDEEQEELIASIKAHDETYTFIYMRLFLAICAIAALAYLPAIFGNSSTARIRTNAFMSISSLACTAIILTQYPLGLGAGIIQDDRSWQNRRRLTDQFLDPSLTQWYIPMLNGALCFILAFQAFVAKGPSVWPPGWLPAVIFALIIIARELMKPVDVGELQNSRYPYKGA